jgi:hypothetical protein
MKKILVIAVAAAVVSCGNKQQSQRHQDNNYIETTADSVTTGEPADNQANTNSKAIEKIQEFYQKYVFGREEMTREVAYKYCTKSLAKKLADDYDYDGDGYAVWDFRSAAQDGDSDVQEVNDIEELAENMYKVTYNDMGHKGVCIITVVSEGDDILFNEIENKHQ